MGRIVGVGGAEYQNLHDEGRGDPGAAAAEPLAQQRRTGQWHGPEQAFLPESGLKRDRQRIEPRQHGRHGIRLVERVPMATTSRIGYW